MHGILVDLLLPPDQSRNNIESNLLCRCRRRWCGVVYISCKHSSSGPSMHHPAGVVDVVDDGNCGDFVGLRTIPGVDVRG
jgi:hypothetical protein